MKILNNHRYIAADNYVCSFLMQPRTVIIMPFYTEEQIKQARSIDLLTYLQTYEPTELVHVRGNTFCLRSHDSLKLSNGMWYWWSRGFGGNSALDYLVKVKGMKFMDAMKILTEEEPAINHSEQFEGRYAIKD